MHIGLENDYNQIHPHARCEMSNDILYGAYYNSEERVSLYFGKTLDKVEKGWDMEYGLTTGYSGYPLVPMWRFVHEDGIFIAPAYEHEEENYGIVIGYEFNFSK